MLPREALEAMLVEGCSLEEIGRRVDRHPSTVSYWLRKHGLTPNGASAHAARGGISREVLEPLIGEDLSIRDIAIRLGRSYTTVRYWMGRHGLMTTTEARRAKARTERKAAICPVHGESAHVRRADGAVVCAACRADAVTRYRKEAKLRLVAEFGGCCQLCGYDRCVRALHFHHRDRETKRFSLSGRGLGRSMASLREEAAKCVLLCSNCHMEVENGVRDLPD
jgi:transposase